MLLHCKMLETPAASVVPCSGACLMHGHRAQVGIFDADVYGPSLPTMVSPELPSLQMNPETRAITPTEYQGVSLVSFGFAGQVSWLCAPLAAPRLLEGKTCMWRWWCYS